MIPFFISLTVLASRSPKIPTDRGTTVNWVATRERDHAVRLSDVLTVVKNASQVEIWGDGAVWDNITAAKQHPDDLAFELETTNRAVIHHIASVFHLVHQEKTSSDDERMYVPWNQYINLRFTSTSGYSDVRYVRIGPKIDVSAVEYIDSADGYPAYMWKVLPGDARKFERLLSELLRRARKHDPNIVWRGIPYGT